MAPFAPPPRRRPRTGRGWPAGRAGARPVTVHSQLEDAADEDWTLHAEGLLAPEVYRRPSVMARGRRPAVRGGPRRVVRRAGRGRAERRAGVPGRTAVWRAGDEVFAEVALPDEAGADGFAVHPALLDAAPHSIAPLREGEGGGARVPFAFTGVGVHEAGASRLRVRLTRAGETVHLLAAGSGAPVASVEALVLREIAPGTPVPRRWAGRCSRWRGCRRGCRRSRTRMRSRSAGCRRRRRRRRCGRLRRTSGPGAGVAVRRVGAGWWW